jgi:cell division septal protein FtsQ
MARGMIEQGLLGRSLRSLGVAARSDRRRRGRARGRSAPRRARIAVAVLAALALLAGAWMWLRDSPLVAVERVTVTGLRGADAPRIRAALTTAARGMTTLDVRESTLRAAVSSYPVVKGLSVATHFPHNLHITVSEQLPVAEVMVGTRPLLLAADGTVLHDVQASGPLPVLTIKAVPGGSTVQDPTALLELRVLAAAPYRLLARISGISTDYWHGAVVALRQGPSLYMGGGGELAAKWQAALAVLAAPSTAGASYIDVTDPQRAAAGGASGSSSSASATSSSSSSASTTPAAPGAGTSAAAMGPAALGTSTPATGAVTSTGGG